jgi:hypothetical protein
MRSSLLLLVVLLFPVTSKTVRAQTLRPEERTRVPLSGLHNPPPPGHPQHSGSPFRGPAEVFNEAAAAAAADPRFRAQLNVIVRLPLAPVKVTPFGIRFKPTPTFGIGLGGAISNYLEVERQEFENQARASAQRNNPPSCAEQIAHLSPLHGAHTTDTRASVVARAAAASPDGRPAAARSDGRSIDQSYPVAIASAAARSGGLDCAAAVVGNGHARGAPDRSASARSSSRSIDCAAAVAGSGHTTGAVGSPDRSSHDSHDRSDRGGGHGGHSGGHDRGGHAGGRDHGGRDF